MKKYLFAILFCGVSWMSIAQVSQAERDALIDLYNATGGPNWKNTIAGDRAWQINDPNSDVSTWYGVQVDFDKVTRLGFFDNGLDGVIPTSIKDLSSLRSINMSANKLNGNIPTEIGLLNNLEFLWLDRNQFTGAIPESLWALPNLNDIILNKNSLEGNVSNSIGNLSGLIRLDLSENQLIGSIPATIGSLSLLKTLQLGKNNLTGNIPLEIGNLLNLTTLELVENQLSGKIPDFTGITSLSNFSFGTNKFVFLDFEAEFIQYESNIATYNYTPQAKVDQEETVSVRTGESITLTSNQLTSPNNNYQWYKDGVAIAGATNKDLVISNANNEDAGTYIFKASNSVITDLELERNPITLTVTTNTDCVSAMERQALIDFYTLTEGNNWINTRQGNQPWLINDPNSSICDWFGVTVVNGKVTELDLEANNLIGDIPSVVTNFQNLETLKLPKNQLSGTIPSVLGQMNSLITLRLNQNQLTGSIPPELGQLTNLTGLHLYSNELIGTIPDELSGLESILYFSVSSNQLSGEIPLVLAQLKTVQQIHLAYNQFTGAIPKELYTLDRLGFLYLNNNLLTGTIPIPLPGQLPKLQRLWVNGNQLGGTIQTGLEQLPKLRQLWLDNNEFIFIDLETSFETLKLKLEDSFVYSPQAKVDLEETKSALLGGFIKLSSTQLISENNSYQWYKDGVAIANATTKEYIITNASEADAGTYYFLATNSIVTDLTLQRNSVTIEVSDTLGEAIQYFCSSEYILPVYPVVKDIVPPILGEVQWYSNQFEGDLINKDEPLGEYDVYWADNGSGLRSSVQVILDQGAPNIPTYQEFSRQSNATIADLNSEDIEVKWYSNVSSNEELIATELLENGNIYYASQNDNSCRTAVYVFVGTLVPDGRGWQVFCENQNASISDLEIEGMAIQWYTTIDGNETLNTTDALVSGTTYYATQNDGVEESVERKAVFVNIIKTPPPTGSSLQRIETEDQAYIIDLRVYGKNIKWYDRPAGGNVLTNESVLEEGKTYYATQTLACESINRLAVTVALVPKESLDLVDCIKFRPDPGKSYIVSAWVREDAVITQPTEVVYFNNQASGNSESSQLFVGLLNDLLDKVMRQIGVPEVYTPDPEQRKYDPLVPFLKTSSSDNFTIYYFKNIKENGLTVGFSFYLDENKTTKFVFKTPYVRRSGYLASYRYPLIVDDNFENNNDYIRVNFKTAKPCGTNLCVTYDIDVKITNNASTGGWSAQNMTNYEEYKNPNNNYLNPPLSGENYEGIAARLLEIKDLNTGIKAEVQKFSYTPDPDHSATQYENALLQITFENNAEAGSAIPIKERTLKFQPLGPVIKGWQRVASQFDIPLNATDMVISLQNKNGSGTHAYFDDIRIHPFNSNVKSFVYDPVTQRLMAELDENNYATFYEYDKEGGLVRVKKETEEGVYTIQETRSGNYKKNFDDE